MSIKLSICVLTYNRADILRETLNHLNEICLDDWEIVVSNNASDDHTVGVLEEFSKKRELFRFSSTDRTFPAQMNGGRAMRMARGEYCYFLSDDDRIIIDNFLEVFSKLTSSPEFVAAYGGHTEMVADRSFSRECLIFDKHIELELSDYQSLLGEQVLCGAIARTDACMNNFIINEGTNFPFLQQLFGYLRQGKVMYVPVSIYEHIQIKKRMENSILTAAYTEGVRSCIEAGIGIAFKSPGNYERFVTQNILAIQHNVFKNVIFAGNYLCGDDTILRRIFYGGTKSESLAEYRKYHRANLIAEHLVRTVDGRKDLRSFVIEDGPATANIVASLKARADALPVKVCMKGAAVSHPLELDEFLVLQSTSDLFERERRIGARATHQDSLEALMAAHQ